MRRPERSQALESGLQVPDTGDPQAPFSWIVFRYLDRHLSNEDTCMVNTPLKRCSLLLTTSDMCIINKVYVTAPRCKQPICPSRDKSINKIWYIYMIGHPSPIKTKSMTNKCNIMDDFQKLFLRKIFKKQCILIVSIYINWEAGKMNLWWQKACHCWPKSRSGGWDWLQGGQENLGGWEFHYLFVVDHTWMDTIFKSQWTPH